jgi:hypothetical protein
MTYETGCTKEGGGRESESKGCAYTSCPVTPFFIVCTELPTLHAPTIPGLPGKQAGRGRRKKIRGKFKGTGLRMWQRRIEGGAGRDREGEKSREKRETAVSLHGGFLPFSLPRPALPALPSSASPRPNYRARRATPTVHARNLHPTSISSR